MGKQVFALNWKEFLFVFIVATIFNKGVMKIGNKDIITANLICFSFLVTVFILRKGFDMGIVWLEERKKVRMIKITRNFHRLTKGE